MEKRPHYRTKAAWAAAEARKLRQQASDLPLASSMDWRGVQRRMRAQAHLRDEANRYERMAERFTANGM